MKQNNPMKLRVPTSPKVMLKVSGGEDPKPTGTLTYDQINQWSDFVEANPGQDLPTLWKGFTAKYPNSGVNYDILVADLAKLKMANQRLADKRGADLARTTHTGYSFPKMMVGGQNAGRVNADLRTQTPSPIVGTRPRSKSIPKEATEYWFDEKENEVKYIDPQSGDVMYADIGALNDPRMKKNLQQQQKDIQTRNMAAKIMSGI